MRKATLIKMNEHELPTAAFEWVEPGQAQLWIDDALPNRNEKSRFIDQYADVITRDDWLPTDQGIGFNREGRLINGKHRLQAIVKAQKGVLLLVVRGLSDRSRLVMDQGNKRSAHDQIKLAEGFDVNTVQVSTARSMITSVGGPGDRERSALVRDIQLLDRYYVKHRKAIEFAVGNFSLGHATVKGVTIAPVFAPVARAYYTQDRNELARFVEVVATGMSAEGISSKDTAAVVLRNYLIAGRDKGLSSRAHGDRYLIYKKTEIALHAFLKGDHIQRLGQMTIEHELFPIPGEGGPKKVVAS